MPSAPMCARRWKAWVAASVFGPKMPSTAIFAWPGQLVQRGLPVADRRAPAALAQQRLLRCRCRGRVRADRRGAGGTAAAAAIPPAISTVGPAAVALASLRLRCFRVSCPSAFFLFVPFLLCFLVAGKPK